LHYTDQAALELYLIFRFRHDNQIPENIVERHTSVKRFAEKRASMLVLLRLAEASHDPNSHAQYQSAPSSVFDNEEYLETIKQDAERVRNLYFTLLRYSRNERRRHNEPNIVHGEDSEYFLPEDIGHPASFLSIEMRRHLESFGIELLYADEDTPARTIDRPSHIAASPTLRLSELKAITKERYKPKTVSAYAKTEVSK